jgi:hypothetical protein
MTSNEVANSYEMFADDNQLLGIFPCGKLAGAREVCCGYN